MSKYFKIGFRVFPWVGLFILGYMYLAASVELSVADHYSSQTFREMESQEHQLVRFIKLRRDRVSDEEVFQQQDFVLSDQFADKYKPWLNTKMGLVKFDSDGFVVAVCRVPARLNDPDCPPNL